MTHEPAISRHIQPANAKLWAVKTYLDLISTDGALTYGSGLKNLYTMSIGLDTYNDSDIVDATNKAISLGIIPHSLHDFMIASILKNCRLYGEMLHQMIQQRIIAIATGQVINPAPTLKWNAVEARRSYYVPPFPFIARAKKAAIDDYGSDDGFYQTYGSGIVTRIQDVANDADFILTQFQGNEGHITAQQTSFGSVNTVVNSLLNILKDEANCPTARADYKRRSRGALKIIWVIAKLLMGDLTVKPDRKDLELIDLSQSLKMSDGTLASIPFPVPRVSGVFQDQEINGISFKGRTYLGAVSAAEFHRPFVD